MQYYRVKLTKEQLLSLLEAEMRKSAPHYGWGTYYDARGRLYEALSKGPDTIDWRAKAEELELQLEIREQDDEYTVDNLV